MTVVVDPKNANHASMVIGEGEWPVPVPLVRTERKMGV